MKDFMKFVPIAAFILLTLSSGCKDGESGGVYNPCTSPPAPPCSPNPPDSATSVPTHTHLTWSCGRSHCALPVTYDVYLATYESPPYVGSAAGDDYNPGRLEPNKRYYWRIVAKDDFGSTVGPVYCFTTGEHSCVLPPTTPCGPSPSDDAGGASIGSILRWQCGDSQCDLPAAYDVYFGITFPPPKVATVIGKEYDPTLGHSTRYYWKVVAKDGNGSTASADWVFTTGVQDVEILSARLNLRINDENDSGSVLYLHRCSGSWNEQNLTWRNAPAPHANFLDSGRRYGREDGSTWMQFSIPLYVIYDWISVPVLNYGLVVDDNRHSYPGYDTRTEFYTKEKKGACYDPDPFLEVTWRYPGGSDRVSTFYPTDDTWAYEVYPDATRGNRSTMWAGWGAWGGVANIGNARAYIKFHVHLP